MLAMEPILVLVTIYVSIVYGLLYARTPPLPAFFSIHSPLVQSSKPSRLYSLFATTLQSPRLVSLLLALALALLSVLSSTGTLLADTIDLL